MNTIAKCTKFLACTCLFFSTCSSLSIPERIEQTHRATLQTIGHLYTQNEINTARQTINNLTTTIKYYNVIDNHTVSRTLRKLPNALKKFLLPQQCSNPENPCPTHQLIQRAQGRLTNAVIRCLETILDKIYWDLDSNPHHIWESFLMIEHYLLKFLSPNLMQNDSQLNNLYMSLLCNFCLFLDTAWHRLPLKLYNDIIADFNDGVVDLFYSYDRAINMAQTKQTILKLHVSSAQNKALALSMGYVLED